MQNYVNRLAGRDGAFRYNQTDRNLGFKKSFTGMWLGKTDSVELHSKMTLLFKLTVSRNLHVEAMCPSLSIPRLLIFVC